MTNKAAGEIEYGCEGCRLSTYRQPIFHYYVDWCPKCGIERRFFTMASYAVNEKLRQQFHNDVRKAIRLPDGVKVGRPSRWARIKKWFARGDAATAWITRNANRREDERRTTAPTATRSGNRGSAGGGSGM